MAEGGWAPSSCAPSLDRGRDLPSLHYDSSDDSEELVSEADSLLPPAKPNGEFVTGFKRKAPVPVRLNNLLPPAVQMNEDCESEPPSPLLVSAAPGFDYGYSGSRPGLGAAEDATARLRDGMSDRSCWITVQDVLRGLLLLSVVLGITVIIVFTHGLDGDGNWPFSWAQGLQILTNMPAGFAFFFVSDLIAVCITRDWLCGASEWEEQPEDSSHVETMLISLGMEDEEDQEAATEVMSQREPSSVMQALLQALQAGCLGALSVGVLDSLWLNRLNLLLPSPADGLQSKTALMELLAKSVIDSIVYGGLANSFGIIVRRCLFKAESLSAAAEAWKQCILQVMMNELIFWPVWNAVNFAVLPTKLQVACTGLGGLLWNTYISIMARSEAQDLGEDEFAPKAEARRMVLEYDGLYSVPERSEHSRTSGEYSRGSQASGSLPEDDMAISNWQPAAAATLASGAEELHAPSARQAAVLLSPTRSYAAASPGTRPPSLIVDAADYAALCSSPRACRARLWPRSPAPQAGGVWTGTVRMSPASSPAPTRAGPRLQIPSLHSPRASPRRPSPSRTSPTRPLLWADPEAVGGAESEQLGLADPPIAVYARAAHPRRHVSDEGSGSSTLPAPSATPPTPSGMALSIRISVAVPRYPLEGRVSTPAPRAWQRRRARCLVAPLEQTRADRSHSLPERPSELASPLPRCERGNSDLGIGRRNPCADSPARPDLL